MELTFVNVLGVVINFLGIFVIFGLVVVGIIAAILWCMSDHRG